MCLVIYNSGYFRIFALTQGMDYSFNSHLERAWSKDSFHVQIVSPQNVRGDFAGNAEAVRQIMSTIKKHNPKVIFVASGDHIVKMNYATMGIYDFKTEALFDAFDKVKGNDFALDLMPFFINKGKFL